MSDEAAVSLVSEPISEGASRCVLLLLAVLLVLVPLLLLLLLLLLRLLFLLLLLLLLLLPLTSETFRSSSFLGAGVEAVNAALLLRSGVDVLAIANAADVRRAVMGSMDGATLHSTAAAASVRGAVDAGAEAVLSAAAAARSAPASLIAETRDKLCELALELVPELSAQLVAAKEEYSDGGDFSLLRRRVAGVVGRAMGAGAQDAVQLLVPSSAAAAAAASEGSAAALSLEALELPAEMKEEEQEQEKINTPYDYEFRGLSLWLEVSECAVDTSDTESVDSGRQEEKGDITTAIGRLCRRHQLSQMAAHVSVLYGLEHDTHFGNSGQAMIEKMRQLRRSLGSAGELLLVMLLLLVLLLLLLPVLRLTSFPLQAGPTAPSCCPST